MKDLVKKVISLNMDEIDSYDFPLDELFGLEVINKGVKFCFIINFSSKNKNLICCGSGAQDRTAKTSSGKLRKPPFLDRWSWYSYFDESYIAYADPIFFNDESITLGWYVGDNDQWYLETISVIIEKLSKNQNIFHDNILFFSSSGGGFASVCLGTLIKGSKVFVNNAQFFVMNFRERHVNNLFNILYKEFPGLSKSEIIEKINYRLDVIELFKKYKYVPPIHYYVNFESDEDIFNQCIPIIDKITKLEYFVNNLTIFFYNEKKDKPHSPLPTAVTVDIVKSFSQCYLYNNEENNDNRLINKLDNQILKCNDEINVLRNDLSQNSCDVVKQNLLDLKKQRLEQSFSKKEALIIEKQKYLDQKDKEIAERENLLTLKSKSITEKENQINELLTQLKSVQYGSEESSIFQEISNFGDIIVFDEATLDSHNDNSYILTRGNIERTPDGTVLSGHWGDLFFTPQYVYHYDFPVVLELTVVDVKDSQKIRLQAFSEKQKLSITFVLAELNIKKDNAVKFVYDGDEISIFIDGKFKSSQKVTFTEKFRIGVQTFSKKALFKYKDMKVHKL